MIQIIQILANIQNFIANFVQILLECLIEAGTATKGLLTILTHMLETKETEEEGITRMEGEEMEEGVEDIKEDIKEIVKTTNPNIPQLLHVDHKVGGRIIQNLIPSEIGQNFFMILLLLLLSLIIVATLKIWTHNFPLSTGYRKGTSSNLLCQWIFIMERTRIK